MSFKIGDKVKVIQDCSYFSVGEDSGALGMMGVVTVEGSTAYRVKLENGNEWIFQPHTLKLVDDDQRSSVPVQPSHSSCPRCNNLLVSKSSQDPFTGQTYSVNKCPNCGWC